MNKEKIVLKVHKAKITPPVNDNRYSTNVYKKDGKRTTIKANTYEGLIEKLFFFYYPDGAPGKKKPLRLHDIFYEWLEYKIAKKQNSAETKKQNISSYKKYVMDTEIDLMPLKDIRVVRQINRCPSLQIKTGFWMLNAASAITLFAVKSA